MFKDLIIEGSNKKYLIDEYGNVFDIKENKFRKPIEHKKGYLKISFWINGKDKKKFIHRLVLETFNPVDNMATLQVNHIDGNKKNNHISNLEWCTQSENQKHAFANNLISRKGEKNSQSKLSEEDVREIIRLSNKGISTLSLAHDFNISKHTIQAIKSGRLWKHIRI